MRPVIRSAALIAFSIACGYAKLLLFPYLFFVEIFSVAVFLSGALVGARWGMWVGGVARLVFSLGNPLGPPHPWVLLSQVAGASWIGALGGLAGRWLLTRTGAGTLSPAARTGVLALAAALGTLGYDAATNVAQGVVFGSLSAALALGALPALQHLASNVVIFAVVGHLAFPWLSRHPELAAGAR